MELLDRHPTATVIPAFAVRPEDAAVMERLLEWGIAHWLDLTREDQPSAVLRRLRKAWSRARRPGREGGRRGFGCIEVAAVELIRA